MYCDRCSRTVSNNGLNYCFVRLFHFLSSIWRWIKLVHGRIVKSDFA